MWSPRALRSKGVAIDPSSSQAAEPPLGDGEVLWWGREMFSSAEGHDEGCPPVIDLTGRPRFLVFGPFVTLAAGIWRAQAFLDVDPDAAKRVLAFQFGIEPEYTTVDVKRGLAGRQVVMIEHSMRGDGSAQLRLWLKKAAFHGEVRFHGAALERLGDA